MRITRFFTSLLPRESIQKKILLLVLVLYAGMSIILASVEILQLQAVSKQKELHNQMAKRTLGRIIIRELLEYELNMERLVNIQDKRDLKVLDDKIHESYENMINVLKVMKNGGTFIDQQPVNKDNIDSISEPIRYVQADKDSYVIEVLELEPKIIELFNVHLKIMEQLKQGFLTGHNPVNHNLLRLLTQQSETLILRSREIANHLSYSAHLELKRFQNEFYAATHVISSTRYAIFTIISVLTIIATLFIFKQINEIIVARRRLLKISREQQSYQKSVHNALPAGIVVIDMVNHEIMDVNDAALKMIGCSKSDVVGSKCHKFICPAQDGACPITDLGQNIYNDEKILLTKNGTRKNILKSVVQVEINSRPCLVETFIDIDEKKIAEEKQRASEEKFRYISNMATDCIYWLNTNKEVEYITPSCKTLTGYDVDEFKNNSRLLREIIHPDDRKDWDNHRHSVTEDNQQIPLYFRILTKKGEEKWISHNCRDLYDDQGHFLATWGRHSDATAIMKAHETLETKIRKRTEELNQVYNELALKEKMASIGQLAAGVSHEMNNPINFVWTNFATLADNFHDLTILLQEYRKIIDKAADKKLLTSSVDTIKNLEKELDINFILEDIPLLIQESENGFKRIGKIIKSMRDFSRVSHDDSLRPANINKGIEDTLTIARNEFKYYADVKQELGDIPDIICSIEQLNQVFLNLIVNSAQAIASEKRNERGLITIRTYTYDNWVVCEISDNGPGVPENIQSKLFEPFFTTKPPGQGTGLGLSISYDIVVHKHHGHLEYTRPKEGGSRFTLRLPVKPPKMDGETQTN